MKVSISDAARLAGVSRQTLYDRINSGTLSRTPEGIDVAELARVYPELKPLESLKLKDVKKDSDKEGKSSSVSSELLASREAEIEWLKEELEKRGELIERKDRELAKSSERLHESNQQWQEHMQGLRKDFQKLLEAPPEPKRKKILGLF